MEALFEKGQFLSTPGALLALERNEEFVMKLLLRHITGDWGELDEEDKREQMRSLKPDSPDQRIMSSYQLKDGTKVWLITEWNRSATTMLLPEEY
jgi:hypothetical protein